jgi:hypothetical protein
MSGQCDPECRVGARVDDPYPNALAGLGAERAWRCRGDPAGPDYYDSKSLEEQVIELMRESQKLAGP